MKTIRISFGGHERKITDAQGKAWTFELHPRFGPVVLDSDGDHATPQPDDTSAFWSAVIQWARQGAVIRADGFCTWAQEGRTAQ